MNKKVNNIENITNKQSDYYYSIARDKRIEIKVKSSKFIASAYPAETKEKAKEILGTVRTEFFDASHNCFAYRIGHLGMDFRASDDGEPNGSAGKPILFTIKKYDLSDLIVIVTRYFGGTKLGVGGLARAYAQATEEVLEICERKKVHITKNVQVFCTYDDLKIVKHILNDFALNMKESYLDAIEIIAEIHQSKINEFQLKITELTAGRAGTKIIE